MGWGDGVFDHQKEDSPGIISDLCLDQYWPGAALSVRPRIWTFMFITQGNFSVMKRSRPGKAALC